MALPFRVNAMNLILPTLAGAAEMAELPGDSGALLLNSVGYHTGLFADDSPHRLLGMMAGLSGVATALAVAIILTVYFRGRYRSSRDLIRHGIATALALGLFAFVAYDMRHAALAYLGINATKPAIEFEIRLPATAMSAIADSQVELRTDRNQTLAELRRPPTSDDEGRSLLRGSLPLHYRTKDRIVVLNTPGQSQCEFRLRLAADPSRSEQFGPWHLADRIVVSNGREETRRRQNDAYAIRYRVL